MAVTSKRISTIQQARRRRLELPRYLKLDGSRYLLGVIVILALMSLIALAQTGVVATKGYAIAELQRDLTNLQRERNQLLLRQAEAQSLEKVRARAETLGMRQIQPDQVRYLNVQPLAAQQASLTATTAPDAAQPAAAPDSAQPTLPTDAAQPATATEEVETMQDVRTQRQEP
ncbi:MAG: hypothetical protein MUD01_09605 [Chloroflexaceae bacterium]|jgi:hypothetical protein|nr:hypothetical protein [Chloroflexaceae bacterium]